MSLTSVDDRLGDGAGALGAVGEDAVDLGRDRPSGASSRRRSAPSLATAQLGQRLLEGRELRAAELAQAPRPWSCRRARRRCRRGCRPRGAPSSPASLGGQRLGIGLRLLDLLGDGVGIVGQVDARQVGRVRLRHLLGAVAQAHDARRRSRDHRLGQREEDAVRDSPPSRSHRPKSLLNFCAMSRASSRCCFWSSPTGTCVAR